MSWLGPICRSTQGDYSDSFVIGEEVALPAAPGPWYEYRWLCLREDTSKLEIAVKLFANSRSTRFEGCVPDCRAPVVVLVLIVVVVVKATVVDILVLVVDTLLAVAGSLLFPVLPQYEWIVNKGAAVYAH